MSKAYECEGQMSIDEFLEPPKKTFTQEEADWWFIHNSTPIIHNGKPAWRVNNAQGDIVDYEDRIAYLESIDVRCKGVKR